MLGGRVLYGMILMVKKLRLLLNGAPIVGALFLKLLRVGVIYVGLLIVNVVGPLILLLVHYQAYDGLNYLHYIKGLQPASFERRSKRMISLLCSLMCRHLELRLLPLVSIINKRLMRRFSFPLCPRSPF